MLWQNSSARHPMHPTVICILFADCQINLFPRISYWVHSANQCWSVYAHDKEVSHLGETIWLGGKRIHVVSTMLQSGIIIFLIPHQHRVYIYKKKQSQFNGNFIFPRGKIIKLCVLWGQYTCQHVYDQPHSVVLLMSTKIRRFNAINVRKIQSANPRSNMSAHVIIKKNVSVISGSTLIHLHWLRSIHACQPCFLTNEAVKDIFLMRSCMKKQTKINCFSGLGLATSWILFGKIKLPLVLIW